VNVLIEAMALGTPLVSTDCGGAREILEQGRLGKIVPTAEPAALAQAITQTLDSPGHSGQLTAAAQRFASGPIADEYLAAMGLKTSHGSMGRDTHYVVTADQD
jgi:glycosyltransferase involved in cell wall biosynthesis